MSMLFFPKRSWAHATCGQVSCRNPGIIGISVKVDFDTYKSSRYATLKPSMPSNTSTYIDFMLCPQHEVDFRKFFRDLGFHDDDFEIIDSEHIKRYKETELAAESWEKRESALNCRGFRPRLK